jgi:hypothetical protein
MDTTTAAGSKGSPVPIRFSPRDARMLGELKQLTGLPIAEIVRRAVRFAGPKFTSGEVQILEVRQSPEAAPATDDPSTASTSSTSST